MLELRAHPRPWYGSLLSMLARVLCQNGRLSLKSRQLARADTADSLWAPQSIARFQSHKCDRRKIRINFDNFVDYFVFWMLIDLESPNMSVILLRLRPAVMATKPLPFDAEQVRNQFNMFSNIEMYFDYKQIFLFVGNFFLTIIIEQFQSSCNDYAWMLQDLCVPINYVFSVKFKFCSNTVSTRLWHMLRTIRKWWQAFCIHYLVLCQAWCVLY